MLFLKAILFGLLACLVGAIKIDVTINGSHVNSIPAGSDVILNCSVPQGDAVHRFDWLKGNQSVSDNVVTTSFQGGVWWSTLVLQNVSPVNTTAMYTCRTWKNNSTKATLQRYVCVDETVLQVKPKGLFMDAGDSSVITCRVQANCEVPSLQWLDQSGNIITDKHRIENTSRTELRFKLSDVKQKDDGIYYCRAINSAGREVKKEKFFLIVREVKLPIPPSMTSPHQSMTGYRGNNVTLSFSTQNTPRPWSHGVWYYEGRVLQDSSKYTVHYPQFVPGTDQGFFSMTVHDLEEDDSGNYTLRVTTAVTPPAIGHVQLTVQHNVCVNETVLKVNSKGLFMDAGDSSVITCRVQGGCEVPSLQWLDQSGNIITDKHRIESTSRTELRLKLSGVKQKDDGFYYCRAINSAGREVKKEKFFLTGTEVKLTRPPLMTSSHQSVTGYRGNNVTLSFSTQNTPRPWSHGVWNYEGRVLHDSSKYTVHNPQFVPGTDQGFFSMTVHDLAEDDSGNYTLRVTTAVTPPAIGHVQLTVQVNSNQEISGKSLVWIPIALAGIFMLVVMVIGFTCLYVKRHKKIKIYFFYQGFGRTRGQEEAKEHVQSYQIEHNNLHSDI